MRETGVPHTDELLFERAGPRARIFFDPQHARAINPHDYHLHHASPQIAMLAAQDVIKSRMRLHLADAFKVTCHGGPLDKLPQYRLPYEAVMASTDPVALDTIGWEIVVSTLSVTCRDRSSTRSASHKRRMSTSAGRHASWET